MTTGLSPAAFAAVSDLFHQISGIRLTPAKHALVAGRLQRLAQECGGLEPDAYVQRLLRGEDPDELTRAVDRLTTNETYFFREPEHFDILKQEAATRNVPTLRVWSAASSSGEEGYSIAMTLSEHAAAPRWEVVGTDLSTAMVDTARAGLYPMERAQGVPLTLLRRYCLKGEDRYAGKLLISRELRQKVRFLAANLTQPLPDIGEFDIVFLRNVLIYFDAPGKADIVRRVIQRLKPDGLLFTGHAESLSNLDLPVRAVAPAVYAHA